MCRQQALATIQEIVDGPFESKHIEHWEHEISALFLKFVYSSFSWLNVMRGMRVELQSM
jgi:hypothetical protein